MSLLAVSLLLASLSIYSYLLARRSGYVQRHALLPFLYHVHSKKVLDTLTDEEHGLIHQQIDRFNLRILSCYVASIVAVGLAIFVMMLAAGGGNPSTPGFIMSILFAYICANYNLNSTVITWVKLSESELLARIKTKDVEESEYDSLEELLVAENDAMVKDTFDEMAKIVDQFEEIIDELGFDPEKDYNDSEEAREELFHMLDNATAILQERYPESYKKVSELTEE